MLFWIQKLMKRWTHVWQINSLYDIIFLPFFPEESYVFKSRLELPYPEWSDQEADVK